MNHEESHQSVREDKWRNQQSPEKFPVEYGTWFKTIMVDGEKSVLFVFCPKI